MSTSIEVERKFDVPEDFHLPTLAGAGDGSEFDLDATYYDTADLRLIGHRVTLRRRLGGHDAGWHLKRPAGADRSEAQFPDSESMPRDVTDQVRAIVRDEPLVPVVRILNHRLEIPVDRDQGRVLVAVDHVRAELHDGDVKEWHEVEVELVDGDAQVIDDVAAELVEAGARPSASASKLARALGDRPPRPPAESVTKASAALAGYLRSQRDELIANDPLVRAGDADGVHDMRVAVRRIRSTLGTFRKDSSAAIPDELKWLSDLIGAVRDRDVLADELVTDISHTRPDLVPSRVTRRIRQRLRNDTASARAALDQALNSPRYFRLLDSLDEIVDAPVDVSRAYLKKRTRKRLGKADDELTAALPSADPAELHEARKSYKKARYAVELSGGNRGKQLTKRLKELQDLLGAHQDAMVASELLKELGDEAVANGESDFGFGVLYAHQQEQAAARRAEIPRVLKRAQKKKIRRWLS